VKALVSSWLSSQPDSEQQILSGWIEDYFYKAVEWVLRKVSSENTFGNDALNNEKCFKIQNSCFFEEFN
jgi:hypothetical protein